MTQHLQHVAFLVHDYDEAIQYFTTVLGFELRGDTPLTAEKRWVLVAPPGGGEASLLLARAVTDEQRACVGRQGAGRVWLFLHTDDFDRDHAEMQARGVRFTEAPREEPYGTVVVFADLYGNRWDLVQMKPGGTQR
ncbi:MAG: VOC family protein [Gemmatimonadaceae bacterium]|nr:VOC family protein [Gemmatimonadaceae bacterium]